MKPRPGLLGHHLHHTRLAIDSQGGYNPLLPTPPSLFLDAAAGDGEDDFFYRFFAPWAGIDEDPVTGSAATVVGPYWATQLGKAQLRAKQLSKRVGELWVEVREGDQRVVVSGHAVPVIEGKFLLPRKA